MIKEGIAIYTIELNGCLNGVYTNEHNNTNGVIYNEVNRIKTTKTLGKDGVSGIYDCFYFDLKNFRVEAELQIDFINNIYYFTWRDLFGKILFKGVGYKMNDRQVVVHYTG